MSAIVLADAGRGDLVLCQVTSRPYGDAGAEPLTAADFLRGRLPVDSYVRPAKLFTAHADLVITVVGTVHDDARHRVVSAVVQVLQTGGVTEHR